MINRDRRGPFLANLSNELSESEEPILCAMERIAQSFQHYDWVGTYWLDGDSLILGPFIGEPTEHTVISVGQGVCGTAISEERNQIVHDVRERANYLSCSLKVRSEIVVLLRNRDGSVVGQIDADSHQIGAFDHTDEELLQEVARLLVKYLP
ncbi:GAF domain-containing protein [bacterium]|nr:GAF domain-containing protein [bacterium]